MEDNKIMLGNNSTKTEETTEITSLEAAKTLRFILPYCRQITALRRFLNDWINGKFRCPTPGFALMIDRMAKQFDVELCAWLILRINYINRERFGVPLSIEDLPTCLKIDTRDGRNIDDVCTQIMSEEDYILGLKAKALFIADQKGELQYGETGYDRDGDNFWQCVTWEKRGFLIPAIEDTIAKCKEEGSPELPSYMTIKPPISAYRRSSAMQSALTIEKYITQNEMYLKGFENWIAERKKSSA